MLKLVKVVYMVIYSCAVVAFDFIYYMPMFRHFLFLVPSMFSTVFLLFYL